MMQTNACPENFIWGAAAASYQIEGAAYSEGKGLSVWDMHCRQPGKIWSCHNGDIACNHYNHYQEDVALMADIGLKAYRLSISWPRLIPDGVGQINQTGLGFYDKLIDALLERQIQPWVTLFHWDFPYQLYLKGGWLNRDSAQWFADYTKVVVDHFSDRVSYWFTKNEPQCYIGLGHQSGEHAPGLTLGFEEVLQAAHHSLLAHGQAVQVIRSRCKKAAKIGAAPVGVISIPATASQCDIDIAQKKMFSITENDCWNNTWFADPMILGDYPDDGKALFDKFLPKINGSDMKTICQPLDFYGVNIYHGTYVQAGGDGSVQYPEPVMGCALTTMDWQVTPDALYWGPKFLYERYKLPLVITENGMANPDWIHADGQVHDPQRIDFIASYLTALKNAIDDGVNIQGYFYWSIMDNFEWALGYKQRFGLVYVDYETGKRTLKDSAHWYKKVIKSNGKNINLPVSYSKKNQLN